MSENSLINFGEISKPATVLIEKVSSAVGVIFEPTRIVRNAQAEAKAKRIMALSELDLKDEIESRAVARFMQQERRRQENIESITAQAVAILPSDAKAEMLDEDWIAYFFASCDTVSDDEMQSLWSRLLSTETANPGSFSKRTVNFVSTMDKDDALLFTKFCQFVWIVRQPYPLFYSLYDPVFANQGVNFPVLKHLDSIGLISLDGLQNYLAGSLNKVIETSYGRHKINLEFEHEGGNELNLGHVAFTGIGLELFPICGAPINPEFYSYIVNKWANLGLKPHSPLDR